MGKIEKFEDLEIWQMARQICNTIYKISNRNTFKNDFKLKDQINGSSGSVMDNIAEGFERNGNKEFCQFLSIAKGSSGEARSQLYRALDREYIDKTEFDQLYNDLTILSSKIKNLMSYIKKSNLKGPKYK